MYHETLLTTTPAISHRRSFWHIAGLSVLGLALLSGALTIGGSFNLLWWGLTSLSAQFLRIMILFGLYFFPGVAVLRLFWPNQHHLALMTRLGLAFGLSVTLPPLLLLIFQLLHLPWNSITIWFYLILCILISLAPSPLRRDISAQQPRREQLAFLSITKVVDPLLSISLAELTLLGICFATMVVRFYTVRNFPTGLWADSYHHTMITQLLIDHHGLFTSWRPYAPLVTFTYHFGFHANAAFVSWLTGLEATQSVIWTGQILNILTVPLACTLAITLGGKPWVGVWAALITGFTSMLPAFLVLWGRYTSLTGMVILVALVVCWITLINDGLLLNLPEAGKKPSSPPWFDRTRLPWHRIALAALTLAALILTHYQVALFAALFVSAYLLGTILEYRSWRLGGALIILCATAAMLALVLIIPWLVNLPNGRLTNNATTFLQGGIAIKRLTEYAILNPTTPFYVSSPILLGAFFGLCIAGWYRAWRLALPALWSLLLISCAYPHLVGLPGLGIITQVTAFSGFYLTMPILAGYAFAQLQTAITTVFAHYRAHWLRAPFFGFIILGLISLGTAGQPRVIQEQSPYIQTQMVTEADMTAMDWIRNNTPSDAQFLVNSTPEYGGAMVVGTDAGWWIPLLAGRATNLPPMTYGSEVGETPQFLQQVNQFSAQLRGRPLTDTTPGRIDLTRPDTLAALYAAGITYIYHGAHTAPNTDEVDVIDTAALHVSSHFQLVYTHNGVEIFQLLE